MFSEYKNMCFYLFIYLNLLHVLVQLSSFDSLLNTVCFLLSESDWLNEIIYYSDIFSIFKIYGTAYFNFSRPILPLSWVTQWLQQRFLLLLSNGHLNLDLFTGFTFPSFKICFQITFIQQKKDL